MDPEVLTIKGEKFAILPLNIYEKLLEAIEDAQDIADAKEIEAKIASGEMECFPSEFVDRLLSGTENKIKVWREYRGLTQEELAKQVNISLPMVKKLESGESKGSIDTIKAIARALNTDIDTLV